MTRLVTLLSNHRADLERSGLSSQTIERWGCYSIEGDQPWVMNQLGFGHIRPPALALPILPPDRQEPDLNDVILKPDQPRTNTGRVVKYETRPRSSNRIHVPLSCRGALGDTSVALWVTEGQKKAEKAAQEGLCCIAVMGVWNWLVRVSSDASFPLQDFDAVAVMGREIIIAFDSDAATKPAVRLACRRLAEFLAKRGGRAFSVQLPAVDRVG